MSEKELEFDVEITSNMCDCFEQSITSEVCGKCGKMRYTMNDEVSPEHYGPYGTACMNTGQFDAGECWMCYARRKKAECIQKDEVIDSKLRQIDDLTVRCTILMNDAKEYKEKAFEACVEKNAAITEKNDMQLVAGRYQFMHERALKALNTIDDQFEYAYKNMSGVSVQVFIHNTLAAYTEAVGKIARK